MKISPTLYFRNSWEWFRQKSQTKTAEIWLGTYSFFESFLLPVPTEVFMALMIVPNRKRAIRLVIVTTLTSVLGAIALYVVTIVSYTFVFESLIARFNLIDDVARASQEIQKYVFVATFIGAFTPLPYTPFVLAAGVLRADLITFIIASLVGRGLRYTIVGAIVYFFGANVLPKIGRWAVVLTGIAVLLAVVAFFLWQRQLA